MTEPTTQERFKRGAADAGRFFQYMADFVDFSAEDAAAIRETRFIIEKYIPAIVAGFYTQLLRFPATRRFFLRKDGTLDQPYLEMRMHHQASFWRRAASGHYGEDFARFVDYVGRAHTSHGADPKIYIHERYVIGMVGYVQQRVAEALAAELGEIDPALERRAAKAWNALLMVILELLARSYEREHVEESFGGREEIDDEAVLQLAVETYERGLGMARRIDYEEVFVAQVDEIPDGARKIIQVGALSIGVFHHKGEWVALHNSCLHRGGPVCAGTLEDDTLTCPWHGYQYDVSNGQLLLDRTTSLPSYPVEVRDGGVYIRIGYLQREELEFALSFPSQAVAEEPEAAADAAAAMAPAANEFRLRGLKPGQVMQVHVDGEPVAVYNVDGEYFATHDVCTHAGGPLSGGELDGNEIICPWHDSCFNVTNGAVTCGPATEPVAVYRVVRDGEKGVVLGSQD